MIKDIIKIIGQFFSLVFPPVIARICRSVFNYLYTGYLRRQFYHFGTSIFKCRAQNLLGLQHISVGDGCVFDANIQLTARCNENYTSPHIEIGNNCLFRYGCHITAINEIIIGDNLLTGTNVLITDNAHGAFNELNCLLPPNERTLVSRGKVHIGNNVWLGNNVCVLPNVTIGDGAVVGANSVVTKDIPAYSTAVGIPAKVIKQININSTK